MTKEEKIAYLNKYYSEIDPEFTKKYNNNLPEDILLECVKETEPICLQNEDEYRWYCIYDGIYKFGNKYFSFPYVKSKSEDCSNADLGFNFTIDDLVEVEPIEVTTIRYKNK